MFSIIIPTWNNLPYLQICIESLRKYSQSAHEIIVHVNEGTDGSLEWVKAQGLRYTWTEKNVGVCMSVNHLAAQASHDWILYLNDDMVACPGWDTAFLTAIDRNKTDLALYYATLIQANIGKNHFMVQHDFGSTPENFDEARMLKDYLSVPRNDLNGGASQPTLFHRKWWHIVGGYSLEFSPGMSSDNDLLMKYWVAGCRDFHVVGACRFYHFSCKSTGRIKHNMGGKMFAMKWGITQKEFERDYLEALAVSPEHLASAFPKSTALGRLRRVGYGLRDDYPLEDIAAWDATAGRCAWKSGN